MTVLLKIKTQGNTQSVEVAKNVANQAVKIQHVGGTAVYELLDLDTNVAPQQIVSKRVGDDLHIIFKDSQDEDLIIADYYKDPALIEGLAENGQYYPYIPANSESASAIAALNDSMLATEVLGGEAIIAGWVPHWGWVAAGVAAIAGIAAIASSGGNGSSSSTPKITTDTQPNDPEATPVKDQAHLTPDEKTAVEKAVRDANPDIADKIKSISVADDGTVTVTYTDDSTDTIKPAVTLKDFITKETDPTDLLDETTGADTRVIVEDDTKLTDDDKANVLKALKENASNANDPLVTAALNNTDKAPEWTVEGLVITYPDGSIDTIPYNQLVKEKITTDVNPTDLYKEAEGENPAEDTRILVDDDANISDAEKAAVIEALKANAENAGKQDVIDALNATGDNAPKWEDGKLVITYADGSTDEIALDQLIKEKITTDVNPTDLYKEADGENPAVDTRVVVEDDANLTDDDKAAVIAALKANSENAGKQDVIDALNATGDKAPKWEDGKLVITYADGSTDEIALDQLIKEKITTDTQPNNPAATPVENKEHLTDAEKTAVEKAVRDANPDIADKIKTVTVADDGTVTVTYTDDSTDEISPNVTVKDFITKETDPTDLLDETTGADTRVIVKDDSALTDTDKENVIKALKANSENAGKQDVIDALNATGDNAPEWTEEGLVITYADGSKDTIKLDQLVKNEITKDTDPVDLFDPDADPSVDTRIPVLDTEKLTPDDQAKVIEELKKVNDNPDVLEALTRTDVPPVWQKDENGKDQILITYSDGSTDLIPLDQVVKLAISATVDPTDLNNKEAAYPNQVEDTREPVVYPRDWEKTAKNAEETARIVEALKLREENIAKQDVMDALNNEANPPKWTAEGLLITYLDGSTDVMPIGELVKSYEPVIPELRALNTGEVLVYLPENMVKVTVDYTNEQTDEKDVITFTNNNDGTWSSDHPDITDLSAGDYARIAATAVADGTEVKAHSEISDGTESGYSRIIEAAPNPDYFTPADSESAGAVPDDSADYKLDTLAKYKETWEANGVTVESEGFNGTASDGTPLTGTRLKVANDEKDSQYVITGDMISSAANDNVNIQMADHTSNNAVIVHGDISGAPNTTSSDGLIDFSDGFTSAGATGYTVRAGVRFGEGSDLLWVGASNPNVKLYFNPTTGYSFTQTEGSTLVTPSVTAAAKETTGGSMRYAEVVFDNVAGDGTGGDDTLVVEGTSDKDLAKEATNAAIYNSMISLGAGNDTILTGSGTGEVDYSGMILNSTIVLADTHNEEYIDWAANEVVPFKGDNTIITTGLKDSVVDFGVINDDIDGGKSASTVVNDDTISIEYGTDNGLYSSTGNQINMGHGVDTLIFTGTDQTYVLADISSTPMSVETVKITGDNNKVTVALSDLLDDGNINVDPEIGQDGKHIFRIGSSGEGNTVDLDENFVSTGQTEVSEFNNVYDIYSVTGYDNLYVYVQQGLNVV
ncbi:hypothetical protein [Lonepinella sp. BR2271]|uniref:hypothetical protein n=1 Tax=Lonepinella sp. BR2271 TaxID=3434550 RepID=UPI003F6DBCCA